MSAIVLVHGAWSDASAWRRVADLLTAAGHRVTAPHLPAHGADPTAPSAATLDGYVDAVLGAAERLGPRVALVGHSMAGTVISMAAGRRPDLVEHLVYLAAFLLPSGQSLYGIAAARHVDASHLAMLSRPAEVAASITGLLALQPPTTR